MRKVIKFLCIFCCFSIVIESIQCQELLPPHLIPQKASGKLVPKDSIMPPVVTTLKPPIGITAGQPQIINRTTRKIPVGSVESETIRISKRLIAGQDGMEYPSIAPLISNPFLAGTPEKVLAKIPIKKNTGPDLVLTYNLSNGLKDLTINRMYQDKYNNLWVTTVYGGVFKFDGKYFHYLAEAQGLANNTASQIIFTADEEIWFSTYNGISRYDGKYMTNYSIESGLLSNWIRGFEEDKYGNIWIATSEGLQMIDKNKETIYTFNIEGKISRDCIQKDHKGNLWLFKGENNFVVLDINKAGELYNFKFNFYYYDFGSFRKYHKGHSGNIWIGTHKGFYKFSLLNNDYENLIATNYDKVMNSSAHFITNIDKDANNKLWISTRGNGVFVLEPGNNHSSGYYSNLTGPTDIPDSFVSSVFYDNRQNIWMGSGGLSLRKKNPFHIVSQIENPTCIAEDQQKNMWIGSDHGLYKFNPLSPDTILLYTQKEGLPGNHIYDLIVDKKGNIWMSIYEEGFALFQPGDSKQSATFTHYSRPVDPTEYITKFIEDKNGAIWFSSYENTMAPTSGLSRFEDDKIIFIGLDQGLINENVLAMDFDISGNFWIGSWGEGINKYEPDANDGKANVTHYTSKQIPIENRVRTVKADSKGNVWTGGYGAVGITQFLPSKNERTDYFRHYSLEQGLSSTHLMSALEDDEGNIWFGTAYGLNLLPADQVEQPTNHRPIIPFMEVNGFPIRACERNVLFQSSDGLIWVGADNRLFRFDPKELTKEPTAPLVFLNEVSLFNQSIPWKKDTTFVLENGIIIQNFSFDSLSYFNYLPQGLSLSHNNNFIDFDYGTSSIDQGHNISYQTILEGLEENWSSSTTESKISYNGLRPGNYLFKVKAKIKNGVWGEPIAFSFLIRPPLWQTWWAYTLYVLIGFTVLYYLYRFQINRKLDKAQSLRLIELDAVKTRMYTNITHEFRTPLTVISGMASQIKENPKAWFGEGISMIQRNANRLLELVNQMLDLTKLESGKTSLHNQQGDILTYLKYIVESIHSFAESKKIQVHFHEEGEELIMDFDPEKIQQIMINLLSNAVKYTPAEGHVYVLVRAVSEKDSPQKGSKLQIKVKNTGAGIPEDQLPYIFDRFYQVDDSATRMGEGSGIGLALVKELVKLMKGDISVKSKVGKETEFTFLLPISNVAPKGQAPATVLKFEAAGLVNVGNNNISTTSKKEASETILEVTKPRVLLVEDNPDVVVYTATCLQGQYEIQVAKDGQEGIDIAIENIPDVIITDVMMPHKDGFEVCQTLKTDQHTSHIPIILLTAKADMESKIEGLEKGADAYLVKPFHKKELLVRVKKLLELRLNLQKHYRSILGTSIVSVNGLVDSPKVPMKEELFVQKLREVVEAHIEDYDFTVERFCKEVAMSHSQLHRKMTALTGLSPNKFIRHIRLDKAKVLLQNSEIAVNVVAYETGFNDPGYFGRLFKKEFGLTPLEWKEKVKC